MRVNWRLVFAAPFVLVACKKPIADPVQVTSAQPRDAAVEVAEVASAPADAAPPTNGNPAASVRARIINVSVVDDGTAITTNRGRVDGIDNGWRGCVLDSAERCILGGQLTISAVSERTSRAIVRLTPDQLRKNANVKLEPPP